jgi:hypothetical protein
MDGSSAIAKGAAGRRSTRIVRTPFGVTETIQTRVDPRLVAVFKFDEGQSTRTILLLLQIQVLQILESNERPPVISSTSAFLVLISSTNSPWLMKSSPFHFMSAVSSLLTGSRLLAGYLPA